MFIIMKINAGCYFNIGRDLVIVIVFNAFYILCKLHLDLFSCVLPV